MKCLIIALGILLLSGCVEKVDITPFEKKEVVVSCLLTDASIQNLTLSYSSPLGKKYYEEVEEAKITLFEEEAAVGVFTKKGYSKWQLSFTPKATKKYRLTIEIQGKPTITATTQMPQKIAIRKMGEHDTDRTKHFEKSPNLTFWAFAFHDPKDTILSRPSIEPYFRLLDELGTNSPLADSFNHIKEGSSTITSKIFFSYIRMKQDDNTSQFHLEGNINGVVVFRAASEEYDQYLKTSLQKMLVYESFDDPSQWLDESEIYSNIQNGIGIFGAYSDILFNYTR